MPQYCDSYAGLLCVSLCVCVSALYVCMYALLIYGAHFLKLVVKIKLFAKLDKKTEKKELLFARLLHKDTDIHTTYITYICCFLFTVFRFFITVHLKHEIPLCSLTVLFAANKFARRK